MIRIRIGLPFGIHGKVNLGIEPLLCGSCPDCILWLTPRVGALCNGWHRSYAPLEQQTGKLRQIGRHSDMYSQPVKKGRKQRPYLV